jgi:hypothetical protein
VVELPLQTLAGGCCSWLGERSEPYYRSAVQQAVLIVLMLQALLQDLLQALRAS